jgi:menaquinone-9 beta-reductase
MTDVLVIGGGPSGAAAGYWLARNGHSVTIVEKRTFPRNKTCGDALSPRAVHQLREMGLEDLTSTLHRVGGVRACANSRELQLSWPEHPLYPSEGRVARRSVLDAAVIDNAVAAGVTLLEGHEALHPLVERGFVRGTVVQDVSGKQFSLDAKYVILADGANSRFGRALGTSRAKEWPYGTAIRSYWATPRHAEPWLETHFDIRDRNDQTIPGYGWVYPVGDGTVNIGVGLLSTFRDFKNVNTSHLLSAFAEQIADAWQIDPEQPLIPPMSGRIPMGNSVSPLSGPTYLVVGDAAGSVNPFSGDGIAYSYATGRAAAMVLDQALSTNDATVLQSYSKQLDDEYGQYFKVGRLFAAAIGRPTVMRQLMNTVMRSRTLADWLLRISSNTLRDDERGMAELAYKAATIIVRLAPKA